MSPHVLPTKVNPSLVHRQTWKLKNNDAEGKQIQICISLIPHPSPAQCCCMSGLSSRIYPTPAPSFCRGWGRAGSSWRKKRKAQQGSCRSGSHHTHQPYRNTGNKERNWGRNLASLITVYLQSLYRGFLVGFIGNPAEIDLRAKPGLGHGSAFDTTLACSSAQLLPGLTHHKNQCSAEGSDVSTR